MYVYKIVVHIHYKQVSIQFSACILALMATKQHSAVVNIQHAVSKRHDTIHTSFSSKPPCIVLPLSQVR